MTALRRYTSCSRSRTVAGERSADGVWPVEDPDEAIAVGYLASYYRRTWMSERPNGPAANQLLRCLLHGAQHAGGS